MLFHVLLERKPFNKLHHHEDSLPNLVDEGINDPYDPLMLELLEHMVLLDGHALILLVGASNNLDSKFLFALWGHRRPVLECWASHTAYESSDLISIELVLLNEDPVYRALKRFLVFRLSASECCNFQLVLQ